MNQENRHLATEMNVDNTTTDETIVRAMTAMRGNSPFALLCSIYEVAIREYGFKGTMNLALEIVGKIPEVRVEQQIPLEQSQVFSDSWKQT